MARLHSILLISLLALNACAIADEPTEDPNASFLSGSGEGKADTLGIPTAEVEGVLHYANTLTQDELDFDVALDIRAARNIVSYRQNAPFTTLQELDAVPWVGPAAFRKLLEYTQANPVTPAPPAEFCGDGVVSGAEECDDANNLNFDGCSATCEIETLRMQGSNLHNFGGFRRLAGDYNYEREYGNREPLTKQYYFFAETDVTLRFKMHDGSGGTPRASTIARHNGQYGVEDAVARFTVRSQVSPFEKILEVTGPEFEVDLPAGPYRISHSGKMDAFMSYTYSYVIDVEVLGETSSCLRKGGCTSESYTVAEYEGNKPSYQPGAVDLENKELRFVGSYSSENWPVEVGQTKKFDGYMSSNRTKYFLFRIDKPTRLMPRGASATDWRTGGGYTTQVTVALYRHDITKASIGHRMPNLNTYDLEPGDYIFQLTAKEGWATPTANKTTFNITFLQTPL